MEVVIILVLASIALLAAAGALVARPLAEALRARRTRDGRGIEPEKPRAVPRSIEPNANARTSSTVKRDASRAVVPSESEKDNAVNAASTPSSQHEPQSQSQSHRGRSIWAETENLLIEPGEGADDEGPDCPVPLVAVRAGARTDRGRRRKNNEDSLLTLPTHGVYVVADGMGGHAAGEVASRIAVETIAHAFEQRDFGREMRAFRPERADQLVAAIEMANAAVWNEAGADRAKDGMGTTVVAARVVPTQPRLYVAFVGDSRCYRLRDGLFVQLTDDHTMAQFGFAGPQAEHLTRSVGIDETVLVELVSDVPIAGDVYLLCSDGLTKMVSDATIRKVLRETDDPDQAAERLVRLANENGGRDNVTVVVLRITGVDGATSERGARRPRRTRRPVVDERAG